MSPTTTTSAPHPAPPARSRSLQLPAVVATIGLVVALVGIGLSLRPLATPTQDCGTAFTFLLHGRVDEFVDPANPPAGSTRADAEANNAEPCQERAANRAVPAGTAALSGLALGLGAMVFEGVVRLRRGRELRRRAAATTVST